MTKQQNYDIISTSNKKGNDIMTGKEFRELLELAYREVQEEESYNCPIEDYNCPYCNANAECMMDRPQDECEDFQAAYADILIDRRNE